MKEKFLIDQLTTTNANLVDQIGRMQTHIEGLWEEVGFKNEKINDLHFEKSELNEKFKDLYKKLYEMEVRTLFLREGGIVRHLKKLKGSKN